MVSIADADRILVRQARDGEYEAFERLLSKYERRIYTLALRIVSIREDAEEVVQETFLTVLEKLSDFREEARFHTWLTRIATNHALGILRRRKKTLDVSFDDAPADTEPLESLRPEYIASWRKSPADILHEKESEAILKEALQELDEKYRLVFLLRDVEEFSIQETAEILGISEANVKVRLLRARLMLREKLTKVFGDENQVFEPEDHHHEIL